MKLIKKKSGFTLVECIVAMAVMSIMSLLLMMMLSATVATRNSNMEQERDIDQQIDDLESGNAAVAAAYTEGIKFSDDLIIPGYTEGKVSANKVSGDNDGVSRLEFDFKNYFDAMGDPPKVDVNANPDKIEVGDWENTAPCFGSIDLGTGKINIHEEKSLREGTTIYDVEWTVKFTAKSFRTVDSLKITLPVGSKFTTWSTPNGKETGPIGYTRLITQYIVMIQPNSDKAGTEVFGEQYVNVKLEFSISEEDYNANCKNISNYFNGTDYPEQSDIEVVPTNN